MPMDTAGDSGQRVALSVAQRESLQILLDALTTLFSERSGEERSRTGNHVSASATAVGNGGTPMSSSSTSTNTSRSPTDQSLNVPLSTSNPRAQFPEPVPFPLPDSTPSSTVTADRRVNGPGSRAFHEFEDKFLDIESKIIDLEKAFRRVGSGGPATSASRDIRKALQMCSLLFRANLSKLYPDENIMSRATAAQVLRRQRQDSEDGQEGSATDVNSFKDACVSDYTDAYLGIASACGNALRALDNFISMYYNGPLTLHLEDMKGHYEAVAEKTKKKYKGFDMDPAVRNEVHTDLSWLITDMNMLSEQLTKLRDNGIPMIREAQTTIIGRYLNMTTIAAFFSGVTATMIQFTYEATSTPLEITTNTILLLSLTFSVASAASSLLLISWRQSYLRPPEFNLPEPARSILMKGPLASLTIAGVLFATGICLFVFSSNQGYVTKVAIPLFGALHATILVVLSLWFVVEQWRFRKSDAVIGLNLTKEAAMMKIIAWIVKRYHGLVARLRRQQPMPTSRTPFDDLLSIVQLPAASEPVSLSHSLREYMAGSATQPPTTNALHRPNDTRGILNASRTVAVSANSNPDDEQALTIPVPEGGQDTNTLTRGFRDPRQGIDELIARTRQVVSEASAFPQASTGTGATGSATRANAAQSGRMVSQGDENASSRPQNNEGEVGNSDGAAGQGRRHDVASSPSSDMDRRLPLAATSQVTAEAESTRLPVPSAIPVAIEPPDEQEGVHRISGTPSNRYIVHMPEPSNAANDDAVRNDLTPESNTAPQQAMRSTSRQGTSVSALPPSRQVSASSRREPPNLSSNNTREIEVYNRNPTVQSSEGLRVQGRGRSQERTLSPLANAERSVSHTSFQQRRSSTTPSRLEEGTRSSTETPSRPSSFRSFRLKRPKLTI